MDKKQIKLPGVKFVLINDRGKEIACGITDQGGELTFEKLSFGRYFLKETECPCQYEKLEKPVEVWIGCENPHRAVEILNERKKGSIKIFKYGEPCGKSETCEEDDSGQ